MGCFGGAFYVVQFNAVTIIAKKNLQSIWENKYPSELLIIETLMPLSPTISKTFFMHMCYFRREGERDRERERGRVKWQRKWEIENGRIFTPWTPMLSHWITLIFSRV